MNWNEYLVLSEKTLSTEFHADKNDEFILHAVMGILTEIDEILDNHIGDHSDNINKKEEFGDITWYCAMIDRVFKKDSYQNLVNGIDENDISVVILNIVKNACRLLDFSKKKLFYNKPINVDEFNKTHDLMMNYIGQYAILSDIDVKDALNINIKKLVARYGDKFSSEKAILRDLNIEREILEGK